MNNVKILVSVDILEALLDGFNAALPGDAGKVISAEAKLRECIAAARRTR